MPQMVYERDGSELPSGPPPDLQILTLGAADAAEMLVLTELTKPGPFARRTYELGTYLGIRCDGKLIAMAGERLKVPGFTEVSAICTHPEHTGRGYARILTTELIRRILGRGETPFLHVRKDNVRAIELYERLGFRCRVVRYHAVLRRD
jgi:predicted GNAT family acetyltransferase